jgi:hypothetical protein
VRGQQVIEEFFSHDNSQRVSILRDKRGILLLPGPSRLPTMWRLITADGPDIQ